MKKTILFFIAIIIASFNSFGQKKDRTFTESLMQDSCIFSATGRNSYFILEPGFQLTLESKDGKGKLVITVLNETRKVGNVETRIVEENESENGQLVEISRNFFAFCQQTSSVYYFGEEVDIYKDGKIVKHEGEWLAGGKNKAGVAMPGQVMMGARYYQEIAPGVAMDRAEILSMNETFETPAGKFSNVLKTEETTPIEPLDKEYKLYAPRIGLIKDENLILVKYGFVPLK